MPVRSSEYTRQWETREVGWRTALPVETSVPCKGAGASSQSSAKDGGRAAFCSRLSPPLGGPPLFMAKETGGGPVQWLAQRLMSLSMTCFLSSPALPLTTSLMYPLPQPVMSCWCHVSSCVCHVISLLLPWHMCPLTLEGSFSFPVAGEYLILQNPAQTSCPFSEPGWPGVQLQVTKAQLTPFGG